MKIGGLQKHQTPLFSIWSAKSVKFNCDLRVPERDSGVRATSKEIWERSVRTTTVASFERAGIKEQSDTLN